PPRSPLFPYTTLFRSGGKFAAVYASAVEALEGIERELRGGGITSSVTGSCCTGDPRSKGCRFRFSTSESCIMRRPGISYSEGRRDRKSTRLNSSHVKI